MDTAPGGPTPATYGIGARVSLYPMSSRYVEIILGALEDAAEDARPLTTSTGPVSTYLGGDEPSLLAYLSSLIAAAARRSEGEHLAASVLLSRGCPGEVVCELSAGPWAAEEMLAHAPTGVRAAAEWSLYPLLDGGAGGGEHMAPILAAIEQAKASGLFAGSDHYVTRLDGDVADILTLVLSAWRAVGGSVQHVTSHLTFSINSPTQENR